MKSSRRLVCSASSRRVRRHQLAIDDGLIVRCSNVARATVPHAPRSVDAPHPRSAAVSDPAFEVRPTIARHPPRTRPAESTLAVSMRGCGRIAHASVSARWTGAARLEQLGPSRRPRPGELLLERGAAELVGGLRPWLRRVVVVFSASAAGRLGVVVGSCTMSRGARSGRDILTAAPSPDFPRAACSCSRPPTSRSALRT